MALVSNNSPETDPLKAQLGDLAGIVQESKDALKSGEKAGPVKKKRGRPSEADKRAAEAAALPPAPEPFDPAKARPAGVAPILFAGIKTMAASYSETRKVPECQMSDGDASACADSLDMAIGVAFPDVSNSRWGVVFACVISAAAIALKFGNEVRTAVAEKKKNEFQATNSQKDPVFSVPQTVGPTPGVSAIQTIL